MLATIDVHVHESCMRVAVRVLHSCAFIGSADCKRTQYPEWVMEWGAGLVDLKYERLAFLLCKCIHVYILSHITDVVSSKVALPADESTLDMQGNTIPILLTSS